MRTIFINVIKNKNQLQWSCALEIRFKTGLAAACGLPGSEGVWDVDSRA